MMWLWEQPVQGKTLTGKYSPWQNREQAVVHQVYSLPVQAKAMERFYARQQALPAAVTPFF
jgi:hypothetical protein